MPFENLTGSNRSRKEAGDHSHGSLNRSGNFERQSFNQSEAGSGEISESLRQFRRGYGITSSNKESEWQSTPSSDNHGEELIEQRERPAMMEGGSSGGGMESNQEKKAIDYLTQAERDAKNKKKYDDTEQRKIAIRIYNKANSMIKKGNSEKDIRDQLELIRQKDNYIEIFTVIWEGKPSDVARTFYTKDGMFSKEAYDAK